MNQTIMNLPNLPTHNQYQSTQVIVINNGTTFLISIVVSTPITQVLL